MGIIRDSAKEIILEKTKTFAFLPDELEQRSQMRQEFISVFPKGKIENLAPEEYFPGLGKKKGCLGYHLEWETRPLGSIAGGSMAKYGSKEHFKEIKKLLIKITSGDDNLSTFYESDGQPSKASQDLISASLKIKGMKSGCTVLGKLLSIYHPNTFLPIFGEQVWFLGKMVKDYTPVAKGLESFIRNNYLLIRIKDELSSEPALAERASQGNFTNDFFYKFLYHCFSRPPKATKDITEEKGEERIEALETPHYQKLIHMNFRRLFKNYRYYEEDLQNEHDGHYSTEDAGVMDFLCLDAQDNFVVIELKRKGTDATLAQLLRYMGWVKENLAKEKQKVLGVIVSESKDMKLDYALKVVPNVFMKQMKLSVSVDDFPK